MKKVHVLARECKYRDTTEHMLDTLIFGTNSEQIKSKLIQKDETLTLDQAIDIARTEEATKQQLKNIKEDSAVHTMQHVHASSRGARQQTKRKPRQYAGKPPPQAGKPMEYAADQHPHQQGQSGWCGYCGRQCGRFLNNSPEQCPAYGSICHGCGKPNHWKRFCRADTKSGRPKSTHPASQGVHTLENTEDGDNQDDLYFRDLEINTLAEDGGEGSTQALVQLTLQSSQCARKLTCKLDTGVEGNVIPLATYKMMLPRAKFNQDGTPKDLRTSNMRITAYGGHTVTQYGKCELHVAHQGKPRPYTFHVVKSSGPIILGLPTCRALGLVTLNYALTMGSQKGRPTATVDPAPVFTARPQGDEAAKAHILQEYRDVFEGIGCFGGEYHVTLDPTIPPVVHPPRRVPVALREALKEELDMLVRLDIIAKVDRPTDWVNSSVCVTKPNGDLRLCLDPKDLNRAIKRPHHFTPTLEDVLPKLNGAQFFTILDARSGYWNIRLDDESSYYTTFNTPYGRHRFLRLPFGLNCAQDIFQKKVDETFSDIPGVTGISDDIIVVGYKADGSDHDANLKAVLERARTTGLRFNEKKMVVQCKRIPFFGNIIGAEGMEADPAKVSAICNMTAPTDRKELQAFLGLANYLSRFTPHLATLSAPLRRKKTVSSSEVLRYYDSAKPLKIQVDASQRGLGAALLQEGAPIAFASKSLTETESRYSNIEREMLGIVFGLERFHQYVYGRHVCVETDHKPLEAISNKHLAIVPPRLERMLIRIQNYDVDIKYVPGRAIPLADALSRVNPCNTGPIQGLDLSVHEIHVQLNASPACIVKIRHETAKDSTLSALRNIIALDWPDSRAECPAHLLEFWNFRDELSVEDGLVLKGKWIVMPKSLRTAVLAQIRYAHQGTEKCKLRARDSVFWCGINRNIEDMVKSCAPCQAHQAANTKEPLMPQDVPKHAWHTLATDLFHWNGMEYLLVADYYSKFPVVRKLNNISSNTVINHLKGIFDEQGIPEKLISDNGMQYSSAEFRAFSAKYGFEHVTSSPLYPQANGFIERTVQTIKRLFTKAKESGHDPHLVMLCLRTTPIEHGMPSPSELLNGRIYKSNLPTVSIRSDSEVSASLQKRQEGQKMYHDRTAKGLPALSPEEIVRVFDPHKRTWDLAKVTSRAHTPRSYNIVTEHGSTYRRNRQHLRSTRENWSAPPPFIGVEDTTKDHSTNAVHDATTPPRSPVVPGRAQQTQPVARRSNRVTKPPDRLDL